ncbi:FtsK/SpoIIIE domain-containing protein [Tepidibacter thalassicus]|uniref:FtsK/SpoIIIE family protein n=1 Tax=Tepidibacter thalassicus DSM 15285 TaxID=1123350 RepID=A0A1M5PUH0_9FIRM|nr:FtsK/SpoIIIE domain-containing protein [Tepidibacter thalassicus]SHH05637.1 FtsK/SpoIIIE family protein [Tepidibacter thalassicus DSM 15285]
MGGLIQGGDRDWKKMNDTGEKDLELFLDKFSNDGKKSDEKNLIEIGLCATAFGIFGLGFMANPLIPISLSGVGIVTTVYGVFDKLNLFKDKDKELWNQFFINSNINVKEKDLIITPQLVDRKKADYGELLIFNIPAGSAITSKKFKEKETEIKEFLNVNNIEIAYHNNCVFIKVFNRDMQTNIQFELINVKSPQKYCIGKNISNELRYIDFEKDPHCLVAGSTNSGKSTILRNIITTAIVSKPNVRLHLVDLKYGAEFGLFANRMDKIENLCYEIDDVYETVNNLKNIVKKRMILFKRVGVLNIQEYNKKFKKEQLDYHLMIFDEISLARSEKKLIKSLEDLMAISRSAGINCILSTQHPSRELLSKSLTCHTDCIIGLKTSNEVNSRVIMGENHSELATLECKGRAILKSSAGFEKIQAFNLSSEETKKLIYSKKKKVNTNVQCVVENIKSIRVTEDNLQDILNRFKKDKELKQDKKVKSVLRESNGEVNDFDFLDSEE